MSENDEEFYDKEARLRCTSCKASFTTPSTGDTICYGGVERHEERFHGDEQWDYEIKTYDTDMDGNNETEEEASTDNAEVIGHRGAASNHMRLALEGGEMSHSDVEVVASDGLVGGAQRVALMQSDDAVSIDEDDFEELLENVPDDWGPAGGAGPGDDAEDKSDGEEGRDVLLEAHGISAEREAKYGSPLPNMRALARLWDGYVKNLVQENWSIEPEDGRQLVGEADAAQMMIQLKMARFQTGTATKDHFTDEAGYARVTAEVLGLNGGEE